jgi:sigma-54 dependent transcriptional regulator, acetoin dehydrogenase operon transcriptional activator AcoR
MKDYGLDPARSVPAQVIEQARLREHQSQIDEFMKIARTGMERLYARVVDDGYVVLFTNAQGITVDFVGDLKNADLKRAGLYLAADWGEERAGTCGVGTCIVEKAPISCHQTDHFNSTHLSLTCNSAPLFDPSGDLLGVLDISALTSPAPRESQHLALQMTTLYAGLIEDANFLHVFRDRWILRLSSAWSMVEVATEIMFAFDADGVIFGMNTGARRAFRMRRLSFAGDRLADPVGRGHKPRRTYKFDGHRSSDIIPATFKLKTAPARTALRPLVSGPPTGGDPGRGRPIEVLALGVRESKLLIHELFP